MATWITHMRIAERLMDEGLSVSDKEFIVGNIGPDCGLPGEDGAYYPPRTVTHFKLNGETNPDLFYEQYTAPYLTSMDHKELSFHLGYYAHLVTDLEWKTFIQHKKTDEVHQAILDHPDFWRFLKQDWYGVDFNYLQNHADAKFWTVFQNIHEFPDYLDIFPQGQILEQIKRITAFYQESSLPDGYIFTYLAPSEMDEFVGATVSKLTMLLNARIGALN
ncbi:zinc dependent phospholipase C family protein [Gorillibacterium timonense]|uniref:zinc dependent phospholipase C family protein n=1 Tax=Gorillibacterium timonense TaxID=1689269 RepID=UPI00071DA33A|nr:zinc dependent phospholipase C family protein [Gorillibacterium timonense]